MGLPAGCRLHDDLWQWSTLHDAPAVVTLELCFGFDYPSSPPFVRVVTPRFMFHTGTSDARATPHKSDAPSLPLACRPLACRLLGCRALFF
eukprot:2981061-Prymnesium_polylepis.1